MDDRQDNMANIQLSEIARECIRVCEEKKAANITLFNVQDNNILTDYYLVCCGLSQPHIRALGSALRREMLDIGIKLRGVDGASATSQWLVLDFGTVIVHIMTPEMRQRYMLENLWDKRLIVFQGGEPMPAIRPDSTPESNEFPQEDDDDANVQVWTDDAFDDFDDEDDEEEDYEEDEEDEEDENDEEDFDDFLSDDEFDDEDDEEELDFLDYDENEDADKQDEKPRDTSVTFDTLFGEENDKQKQSPPQKHSNLDDLFKK
ncbi:MAG: ribosome silencing factor [Victivallales bacterium]|nr:ribosome silencing factor [Victivallales bacterium]